MLQSISSIDFMTWSVLTDSSLKLKEFFIFILNHLGIRMVTETRHLCGNIWTVLLRVLSPIEHSQNFCVVNKIIIKGFRNVRIFV